MEKRQLPCWFGFSATSRPFFPFFRSPPSFSSPHPRRPRRWHFSPRLLPGGSGHFPPAFPPPRWPRPGLPVRCGPAGTERAAAAAPHQRNRLGTAEPPPPGASARLSRPPAPPRRPRSPPRAAPPAPARRTSQPRGATPPGPPPVPPDPPTPGGGLAPVAPAAPRRVAVRCRRILRAALRRSPGRWGAEEGPGAGGGEGARERGGGRGAEGGGGARPRLCAPAPGRRLWWNRGRSRSTPRPKSWRRPSGAATRGAGGGAGRGRSGGNRGPARAAGAAAAAAGRGESTEGGRRRGERRRGAPGARRPAPSVAPVPPVPANPGGGRRRAAPRRIRFRRIGAAAGGGERRLCAVRCGAPR